LPCLPLANKCLQVIGIETTPLVQHHHRQLARPHQRQEIVFADFQCPLRLLLRQQQLWNTIIAGATICMVCVFKFFP
jgi:hypothetical protein